MTQELHTLAEDAAAGSTGRLAATCPAFSLGKEQLGLRVLTAAEIISSGVERAHDGVNSSPTVPRLAWTDYQGGN